MTPLDITHIALVIVGGLSVLLWYLPGPCKCEKCGFHVNEARMAKAAQEELAHDYQHRMGGSKDRLACSDEACPRNPEQPKGTLDS